MIIFPFLHHRSPNRLKSVSDVGSEPGFRATELYPGHLVEYRGPERVPEGFEEHVSAFRRMEISPEHRLEIDGGRFARRDAVVSPDGKSVIRDLSVAFGYPSDDHPLLHSKRLGRLKRLKGSVLLATSCGGGSYYHWLLEEVPKLLRADLDSFDRIVIHDKVAASRELISLLGIGDRVMSPKGASYYRADRLTAMSLVGSCGYATPRLVGLMQDLADKLPYPPVPRLEKLYIDRGKAGSRTLVNSGPVEELLVKEGFHKVVLEDLEWIEQVALFRQADQIVAPHGAGLANIVFCRPGTKVVELFNPQYLNRCFWALASAADLNYRPVLSGSELTDCIANCRLPIEVPIEELRRALAD